MGIGLKAAILDLRRGGPGFLMGGVSARLSRKATIVVKLPGDLCAVVRPRQSDFLTLRQIFRDQEYRLPNHVAERVEREISRLRAEGSKPVVVDAGANIGAASLWFRSRFPEAAIVAIEPDAENAAIARKNLAALPDAILIEAAVGSDPGFVSVVGAGKGWAVRTERASSGCAITTIHDATKAIGGGKLLIVKIDIEGFESDLFSSNLGWMDEALVIYIEPHDWLLPGKGTSRSFQKAFGERNFELYLQDENIIYVRREVA